VLRLVPLAGTITRTYDGLDRLTQEQTPQGTVGYAYDSASRRTQMTVSGQSSAVTYSYDNNGRITGISQGAADVLFAYDAANRRGSLTLPNGVVVNYGYDSASELTGISYQLAGTNLGNITYSYDADGRRTQLGGSWARTGMPNAVTTTVYNANNQLTTWGTANLYYDANGNMTSDGTHSYKWDARNQLQQIDGGATASFTYDAFGRRVNKNIFGANSSFLYDGANTVQELSGTTPTANLLTGSLDEYFTRTDSAGARCFLRAALGSTLALADSAGTLQTSYTFEPYGETTIAGAATTNSFAYTGRELDSANPNLYFYRARYYNPSIGRFISEDPIQLKGGINFYSYAVGSPMMYRDPSGKSIWWGWWCGPNWTGGHLAPYDPSLDTNGYYRDPIDAADSVCRDHDKCYASCRQTFPCQIGMRQDCMRNCDAQLIYNMPSTGVGPILAAGVDFFNDHPDAGKNDPRCPSCDPNKLGHPGPGDPAPSNRIW
jgi:RHS repeat-associated protein